jgi:hypothetical protein
MHVMELKGWSVTKSAYPLAFSPATVEKTPEGEAREDRGARLFGRKPRFKNIRTLTEQEVEALMGKK